MTKSIITVSTTDKKLIEKKNSQDPLDNLAANPRQAQRLIATTTPRRMEWGCGGEEGGIKAIHTLRAKAMTRKTLTRLMTGIFIAKVSLKAVANVLLHDLPIPAWPRALASALQTTIHSDAFYMPAAIALMQHYQS